MPIPRPSGTSSPTDPSVADSLNALADAAGVTEPPGLGEIPYGTGDGAQWRSFTTINVAAPSGDTATDTDNFIKAAAAVILKGGGTIVLQAGTYKCNTTIDLSGVKGLNFGIAIVGAGSGTKNVGSGAATTIENWSGASLFTAYGDKHGCDEQQHVVVDATSGTFTLTFDGYTTSALAWNISAGAMKTALEALTSIGSGNVRVVTAPGEVEETTYYLVTFLGTLAKTDVALMTANAGGLSGLTHSVTITESRKGKATSTAHPITAVRFHSLRIKNMATMASATTFTIDGDYITDKPHFSDLEINANGMGGSGIRLTNPGLGQGVMDIVRVEGFTTGTGFSLGAAVTANVDAGVTGGQIVFNACAAIDCLIGFDMYGHTDSSANIDGCTFNACKVGMNAQLTDSVGWWFRNRALGHTINSPHVEGPTQAIRMERYAKYNVVDGGVLAPSEAPNESTFTKSAVYIDGLGNKVQNFATNSLYDYGVEFGTHAQSNAVAFGRSVSGSFPGTMALYNGDSALYNTVRLLGPASGYITDALYGAVTMAQPASSGTAFPSSPATGMEFTRTDRSNKTYFYDGTRWLLKTVGHFKPAVAAVSATTSWHEQMVGVADGVDHWLASLSLRFQLGSGTLDGSNYWTIGVYKEAKTGAAGGGSLLAEWKVAAGSTGAWRDVDANVTVNTSFTPQLAGSRGGNPYEILRLTATKTGSPGTLIADVVLAEREVG